MRSRSMMSTVLGTSATTRSVRVAVTTTRSNSTAAPDEAGAAAAAAVSRVDCACAQAGSSRPRARNSLEGRIVYSHEDRGELASGTGPGLAALEVVLTRRGQPTRRMLTW